MVKIILLKTTNEKKRKLPRLFSRVTKRKSIKKNKIPLKIPLLKHMCDEIANTDDRGRGTREGERGRWGWGHLRAEHVCTNRTFDMSQAIDIKELTVSMYERAPYLYGQCLRFPN